MEREWVVHKIRRRGIKLRDCWNSQSWLVNNFRTTRACVARLGRTRHQAVWANHHQPVRWGSSSILLYSVVFLCGLWIVWPAGTSHQQHSKSVRGMDDERKDRRGGWGKVWERMKGILVGHAWHSSEKSRGRVSVWVAMLDEILFFNQQFWWSN